MNKETKLQLLELLKLTRDHLDVEETPTYNDVDFMPIASDRFAHTEAVLSLATDVSVACDDRRAETAEPIAPGVSAN